MKHTIKYLDGTTREVEAESFVGAVEQVKANLLGANLTGAKLSPFLLCPVGAFTAFKSVRRGNDYRAILELLIPTDAERTSSLIGRKCRASKVRVISATTIEGEPIHDEEFTSYKPCSAGQVLTYRTGEMVECASGVHFFITREEAVDS